MSSSRVRVGRAGVNVGHVVAQRAQLDPEAVAIVDGAVVLNYRELNEEVNRLVGGLQNEGVEQGDRIAIVAGNSRHYFLLLFACAKLGAIMVTVNFRLVAEEVEYIVADCGAKLLMYGPEYSALAEAVIGGVDGLRSVSISSESSGLTFQQVVAAGTTDEPGTPVAIDAPLLIIYTSGTTGRPKGAILTHGNLLFTSTNQLFDWGVAASDRCLVQAPLFHIGAMGLLSWPTLHVGGTVIIHPGFDPAALLDSIETDRITTIFLAPTMWRMMLQEPDVRERDLSSIRLCASGGESLPLPLMEQLLEVFGSQFTEGYGLTECTAAVAVLRPEHVRAKSGSVGTPFLHVAVRIVDDAGQDVAPEELGEIIVNGPTVMAGYWGRPEATEAKLRDGWLHTGDVGRFDADGFLYIVDRIDDMLISGGENIYPAEVEKVLYHHPEVAEVAVIGTPDEQWGQIVTAVVVATEGASPSESGIAEFCGGKLASFKRPRRVVLVDDLPRNPSGKVLKRVLRERLASGAPR
jgi:fatty-acyl-CoA synthase